MKIRLLKSIFFEKKKNIFLFLLVFAIMSALLVILTSVISSDLMKQKSLPDFIFTGTVYQTEDGSYPFTNYNPITGFREYIQDTFPDSVKGYGVICRSIYNYYDETTAVGFSGRVYGMPDEMLKEQIESYLVEGRLPEKGKKEAVVGYYYSKWYEVSIGDPILSTVTLNEHWTEEDKNAYTVVGILDESICNTFIGSILVSRDTFEELEGHNEDNMILGYFTENDKETNDAAFLQMNRVAQNFRSPEGTMLSNQKEYNTKSVKYKLVAFAVVGIILMYLIVSYFLKGTTTKIGLLKALGLSNKRIYTIFLNGYLVLLALSILLGYGGGVLAITKMNHYINDFYGFDAHTYQIESISYLLLLGEMFVFGLSIFLHTYIKTMLVQPKKAMLSSE